MSEIDVKIKYYGVVVVAVTLHNRLIDQAPSWIGKEDMEVMGKIAEHFNEMCHGGLNMKQHRGRHFAIFAGDKPMIGGDPNAQA